VRLTIQQPSKTLAEHKDWINGLSISKDGSILVSGDDGGNVVTWNRTEGKEVRRFKVKGWVYALGVSPDASQVLVSERFPLVFDSGRHSGIKIWKLADGTMLHDLGPTFKEMMGSAAFSLDGKILALARGGEVDGNNGKVTFVDPASGKKTLELTPGHLSGATDLAFHPDGKHLASSGRDTLVRIWEISNGRMVKELGKSRGGQFKDWIHAISWSEDGRWLAAADMEGAVQLWAMG
jgi:WD40 repeat protein